MDRFLLVYVVFLMYTLSLSQAQVDWSYLFSHTVLPPTFSYVRRYGTAYFDEVANQITTCKRFKAESLFMASLKIVEGSRIVLRKQHGCGSLRQLSPKQPP